MTEEQSIRYLIAFCVLATLATLFLCIVITPVVLIVGFSGQFWPVWNGITSHPVLTGFVLMAFVALVMFWIWLMIVMTYTLIKGN